MARSALARIVLFGLALLPTTPGAPATAQIIKTVAGGGFTQPGISVALGYDFSVGLVQAVAADSSENVYVADSTHGSIYSISGSVKVIAGNGTPGNVPVLQNVTGLALDGKGNLFIADQGAGIVYKMATSGGAVQTFAGCGSVNNFLCPGAPDYGDGTKAASAFVRPAALSVDSSGNVFIADVGTCRIRKVDATTGTISTVAGSTCPISQLTGAQAGDGGLATSAQLYQPQGVAVDSSGDIFIADTGNNLVREVCASALCGTAGVIQTITGGGMQDPRIRLSMSGDAATTYALNLPVALTLDPTGDLYIADYGYDVVVVVNTGPSPNRIEGANIPSGNLQLVAGDGSTPSVISPGDTQLNGPRGLAWSTVLFIADSADYAVRIVDPGGHNPLIIPYAGNYTPDTFTAKLDPLSVQLSTPLAVTEDASNEIYLSENSASNLYYPLAPHYPEGGGLGSVGGISPGQTTSRVLEATPSAAKLQYSPSLPPGGLFADGSNDLFIADGGLDEISETYGLVPVIPFYPSGPSALFVTITGDRNNNLYLAQMKSILAYPTNTTLGLPPDPPLTTAGYPFDAATLGDGSPAQSAQFGNITGLCTDRAGNLYVTDDITRLLRVINTGTQAITIAHVMVPGNYVIETIAGGGGHLPVDPENHFDFEPDQIGDGGPATQAFLSPQACFVDNNGNIFIADGFNDRIRRVDANSGSINSVAGSRLPGFTGDGGLAESASLNFPNSLWGDQAGNLLISDSGNHRIREINALLPVPNAQVSCNDCGDLGNSTGSSKTATVTLMNTGAAPLIMTASPALVGANKAAFTMSSTCLPGLPGLAASTSCQVTVTPTGAANASANVMFLDNASQSNATTTPDPNYVGQWAGYSHTSEPIVFNYVNATANFDPLSLVFTAENVPQAIRVTNSSSVNLVVSGVTVPPPFVLQTSNSDSCENVPSVAPNASCEIYVTFSPSSSQAPVMNPTITISDNTMVGTAAIPLVGYALVPTGTTSLSLPNKPSASVKATFQLVGIPASGPTVTPVCTVSSAGLDLTCTYDPPTQTITASASIPSCILGGTASLPANERGQRVAYMGLITLALLLPLKRSRRKRLVALMAFAVLSYVLVGVSACSSISQLSSSCVASVNPGTTFRLFVTANIASSSTGSSTTTIQYPSLTLTAPDTITVTQ
jgi:sugar lactone lactonase YvrE